jgi:hypothetical protein
MFKVKKMKSNNMMMRVMKTISMEKMRNRGIKKKNIMINTNNNNKNQKKSLKNYKKNRKYISYKMMNKNRCCSKKKVKAKRKRKSRRERKKRMKNKMPRNY